VSVACGPQSIAPGIAPGPLLADTPCGSFITYHYEDKWAELSLNIAISLAAPLMAVVCEEGFKAEFEAAGLTELYDARGKTFEDLANMNLDFNKEIMTMLSPIDGIRDFAVAAQTWVSIDQSVRFLPSSMSY